MKKGFTLIELLAVIVVIVVIALIAVPVLLNVIEKARKGAAEASTYSYLEAFSNYIAQSEVDNTLRKIEANNRYNLNKQTTINETLYQGINEYVKIKGYIPTGVDDYIVINDKYQVVEGELSVNSYLATIENGKIVSIVKGEKIAVESLSIEGIDESGLTMEKGMTYQITPLFSPTNSSDKRVEYKSDDTSIATVSELGAVEGVKTGTVTITATSLSDRSKKAEFELEIIAPTIVTSVDISVAKSNIVIGEEIQITKTLEPSDTTTTLITYTSQPSGIVEIDSFGKILGVSAGTTTITGTTANGLTDTLDITVSSVLAESVSISSTNSTIYLGSTTQVTSTILPSNTTNKTITYTSSNTGVATVTSTGLVTSVSPGNTTITATTSNGKTGTIIITVNPILATSVSISPTSITIYSGATTQLTATVLPSNTTNKTVNWTINNTHAGSSTTGLVTGYTAGTTTVTATTNNGKTATSTITVINKTYTAGTIIYFDPKTNNTCNSSTFNLASINAGTSTCYKWRVLTTGDTQNNDNIKIMLDHNLVNLSAWDTGGTNLYGPRTALANLATATSSWSKVPLLNYTFADVTSTGGYGTLTCTNGTCLASRNNNTVSTNTRARMITAQEYVTITGIAWTTASNVAYFSNSSLGTATQFKDLRYNWFVENLTTNALSGSTNDVYGAAHLGYWMMNSRASNNTQIWDTAASGEFQAGDTVTGSTFCGIRPVIEIEKYKIN